MAPGKELPPAGGIRAEKRKSVPIIALGGIAIAAILICLLALIFLGIASFSMLGSGNTSNQTGDLNTSAVTRTATENDYTGTWQGNTEDGKNQEITFTGDNRFCHWVIDKNQVILAKGSWRYDSSLYVYRLIYDSGDYSASVKIYPISENQTLTMHFEPLSSAASMPLKGFDLEKLN